MLLQPTPDGERYELASPTAMPKAGAFLWNQKMMIQVTSRGHAVAQFMQPEPAKYSHAPNLEMRTFMQPEQGYYAHHPGRFVYIRDDDSGELFSAPYEPVRAAPDRFVFSAGKSDVRWTVERLGLRVELALSLPTHDIVELWTVRVTNLSGRPRNVSVVPSFTIGYMSWMNQSAEYRPDLGGIVGTSITPYQNSADYFKNKHLKDKTYFLCRDTPDAWEANQQAFEGEGGLHAPSALHPQQDLLAKGDARYETPIAAVQYKLALAAEGDGSSHREYRFVFGPALDDAEIRAVRDKYLGAEDAFAQAAREYADYIQLGRGCLRISTPDADLDNFVNHWLPRQIYYHGDVNRLTTDPQTRNYLQDNMGMAFIAPSVTRTALLTAVAQQEASGSLPDGILLIEGAELKYINQIPHTDHCVWLPIALSVYLAETADYALLDVAVTDVHGRRHTVFERLGRAMDWLLAARDHRGLSYIAQGDWCDPMNMVGYKGKGVSGWLTIATAYALRVWATTCERYVAARAAGGHGGGEGDDADSKRALDVAAQYRRAADDVNAAANEHLWDGDWFLRGITDDNVKFGVKSDPEGRIWLNPQAWSILSGAASPAQRAKMLAQVDAHLCTPYGVTMFGPPYSAMREDVGRVTQKYPGSAENASVYNHASIFYIYSLYTVGQADRAYQLLRQMLPGPSEDDYLQRGQLPIYIPNYYRGAWREYPRTAGRSSHLFNTGTVAWVYRTIVESLFGLEGDAEGLRVRPQLPATWSFAKVQREFRGATFEVDIRRADVDNVIVRHQGKDVVDGYFKQIQPGVTYELEVLVPSSKS
jgi:cellobionic acid phosphorylase